MKNSHRMQKEFPAELSAVDELLNFSEECLEKFKVNEQLLREYRLVIEEVATKLIQCASAGTVITVVGFQRLNQVGLRMHCPGKQAILEQEDDEDLGGMILEEYEDYLSQSYSAGCNTVVFSSSGSHIHTWNIIAILLAGVFAFLIRQLFSKGQMEVLIEQLIYPMNSFYMGCMQTIASPVVFFSLTALIVKLRNKFEHDRELAKTFANYLFSSMIAIVIGILAISISPLKSMIPDLRFLRESSGIAFSSLEELIEHLTFTNLLEVFQITDPIPMLLIAILTGSAVSMLQGKEGAAARKAVLTLNSVFIKMLSILYDFIPLFLFLGFLTNLLTDGVLFLVEVILSAALFVPLAFLIFLTYSFRLYAAGMPLRQFFKNYGTILKENYRIGSNIQALPYNRRMLSRKIRMPLSALNDRLTLGAMVNMDGNCLMIAAFSLYMMQACGVSITAGALLNLVLILILLSVGAPNQPGSFLVAMIFIIAQVGISSDIYDIVIILEALLGTAYSFINSVGDIVTILAGAARKGNLRQ